MAEFDITLDGQGYMLVPGSYKSYPDGNLYVDSRLGRQVLTDFTQGMAGPKIGGRNTGPTALYGEASRGAWPAPWPVGFHGIGPAPARVGSGHQTGNTAPKHVVRAGGYVFIASGNELWRWDNASGFTLRYTAPEPIVSATYLMGRIYLAYGEAALTNYWDDVAGVAGPGLPLSHATLLGAIGRRLFMAYADDPTRVTLWVASLGGAGTNEHLDSAPRAVTIYEDSLLIATDRSIYSFRPTGASTRDFTHWGVVSADGLQNDDDFAWFTVFQGRLMAWQGGRAVLYDKQRSWWRHAGLEGQASYGATVVNGWLIASVAPRGGSEPQLWGYNGSGWWLLDAGYGYYPAAARGDRLIAWGEDRKELHYYDMDAGREPVSVGEELTVETALMDAGSPDSAKHWTRIGLELGRPDPAPVGEWGVQLFYSTDAGATWIAAGDEQTVTASVATVSATVGVASTYLRIRAVMTRRTGLPPFILAAWSEYEVLNESVRRRRWQFSIAATDRTIDRAGLPDSRDGAAIRTALWELFETSDSFSFTDVDGAVREVRMIGLREEWQRPADVPKLGAHTLCEVVIVEL